MWGEKGRPKKETASGSDNYTFLGNGVDIRGKAQFEGTVRIDGFFEGELTTDDTLIIGEKGVIKGTIRSDSLVSSGRVEATIFAKSKVQLLKPAVLLGEVHAPAFTMEEGVYFQGSCDMGAAPTPAVESDPSQVENGRPQEQDLKVGQDVNT